MVVVAVAVVVVVVLVVTALIGCVYAGATEKTSPSDDDCYRHCRQYHHSLSLLSLALSLASLSSSSS